ncbi:MAG TPA: SMC-Scp complex subunit ScpB [Asanoa sp.]|nr:SMC-Scp complex subunit ScpB [Asanoa sp.]
MTDRAAGADVDLAAEAKAELAAEAETIMAGDAVGQAEEQDPEIAVELAEAPADADLVDLTSDADPGSEDAATGGSAAEAAGPGPVRVSDADGKPTAAADQAALTDPDEGPPLIDEDELRGALEAIMLVVDEPVQEIVLAQVLEQPTDRVVAAMEAISAGYTEAGHGFELRRAAGGWRLYTRPQYATYVERFVLDGQSVRLTQAALETLAVIAYKQPVTRARISAIRGVNCDGVVRTLTSRGLIEETGTEPETGAYLYRTTTLFLEKLGLDTVDQLPDLAPFLPDDVDEVADGER